jgi:flagellar hook assembly protein FlgD
VVHESSITHVLNYPNPFSTSTAFVFTLTGETLPSQFKIQIFSPTGKIVREITKQELGPLHIGRNITEYKWDGRDQYGQLLGNGVYFYRVAASINGSDIKAFSPTSNSTRDGAGAEVDRFFKNGYGKMYIMR